MEKLLFTLILVLAVGIIYLITGRNRRQINKIPEGMAILCQPPGKRYVVYALGVLAVVFVGIFSILYIMDGAPREARGMWSLCVAMAILLLIVTIFAGNIMARECIYFNGDTIQIEKAFQKPRTVRWQEIRKIDGSFDNMVNLYLSDGTKILTVGIGMVNYELFCDVLRKKRPETVAVYYRSQVYESPQKRILRYGTEYYILAGLGILILLEYLAMLLLSGEENPLRGFSQSEPSEWFSLLFAPIYGVACLIFLFIMCNTRVWYSEEKMMIKHPIRKETELYWRNIQRIEAVTAVKQGKRTWKKLRIYTKEGVYKISFAYLTHGKDDYDFMAEVLKMVEKYEIIN